jgi:hypothetical protein
MGPNVEFTDAAFDDPAIGGSNESICRVSVDEANSQLSAKGSVRRTKALLLAAIRVWEISRGIQD